MIISAICTEHLIHLEKNINYYHLLRNLWKWGNNEHIKLYTFYIMDGLLVEFVTDR